MSDTKSDEPKVPGLVIEGIYTPPDPNAPPPPAGGHAFRPKPRPTATDKSAPPKPPGKGTGQPPRALAHPARLDLSPRAVPAAASQTEAPPEAVPSGYVAMVTAPAPPTSVPPATAEELVMGTLNEALPKDCQVTGIETMGNGYVISTNKPGELEGVLQSLHFVLTETPHLGIGAMQYANMGGRIGVLKNSLHHALVLEEQIEAIGAAKA